jgi:hypothetical protein
MRHFFLAHLDRLIVAFARYAVLCFLEHRFLLVNKNGPSFVLKAQPGCS